MMPFVRATMRETAQQGGIAGCRRRIGAVMLALGTLVIGASVITAAASTASSAPMTARALGPSLSRGKANGATPLPAQSRFRVAAYKGTALQGVANLPIPTWTHTQP